MIQRFLFLFLFYFLNRQVVYSQERSKVDSLVRLIENSIIDSSKVDLLNNLAKQYVSNHPDSTLILTKLSIELSEKINYKKGIAEAHRNAGIVYDNMGEFDKALEDFFTALKIFQSINYRKGITDANNDIGIIYYEQGKYDSALKIFFHALLMREELKDSSGIASVTSNIGLVFHDQGNYEEALKQYYSAVKIDYARNNRQGIADTYLNIADIYFNENNYSKAIETYQTSLDFQQKLGDKFGMAESYSGLGKCYQNRNDLKKAMEYYEKALALYEKIDIKLGIAGSQSRMGTIYQKLGDYEKAFKEFSIALKINEEVGDKKEIIFSHVNLGNIFTLMNKPESAFTELNLALSLAEKAGLKSAIQESYQGLSKVFAVKKDFHKAYDYYLKFTAIKDTLLNAERSKQLAQLQTQYESQKKDQQILLLNSKNMLQQSENKKQTLLRNSFIAGFILIALVALLLLNRYRIKQRSEKALEQAYHHLQQTQQQLVQSEKMASLGQLTAGVAHEINNPINFVSANVNPLKRNFAELVDLIKNKKEISSDELSYTIDETHQLIAGIEEGSRRTAEIVKGLRNFSHIDEEEMKKTNINEGIESTLMLLRNKLTHSNIELIKSLGNLTEIEGYPGQLNQVFINMITNAIDAIGKNGKITIATSNENDQVKISIRDTGSGMNEETKKKIFDPFFTTKDVGKGTGLGLSISYGIIEKHNGTIMVNSEEQKGTEFIITLPARGKNMKPVT